MYRQRSEMTQCSTSSGVNKPVLTIRWRGRQLGHGCRKQQALRGVRGDMGAANGIGHHISVRGDIRATMSMISPGSSGADTTETTGHLPDSIAEAHLPHATEDVCRHLHVATATDLDPPPRSCMVRRKARELIGSWSCDLMLQLSVLLENNAWHLRTRMTLLSDTPTKDHPQVKPDSQIS